MSAIVFPQAVRVSSTPFVKFKRAKGNDRFGAYHFLYTQRAEGRPDGAGTHGFDEEEGLT
ncbi:hypothetical protein [Azospirillum sp.]|uniref:hypothetical protein n=1 Tax=Azospirillum sp. TaxID=34012 RepID=UPI002D338C06|nr:hypothetical protein [Azospirillum sp.]HYF89776.1 hypothetical protein [Azospirillum sp.]